MFWQILAEIYLAAHFQRLDAQVTKFGPPSAECFEADFTFVVDDWSGVVEVHSYTPTPKQPLQPEQLLEQIIQ